jgi:NADPH:quinone reductase-like Zn-dependent oxidoreductase
MRATHLEGFGGPGRLKRVEISRPEPKTDEVPIEVRAGGVNYADTQQALGKDPTFGRELPFVPGVEWLESSGSWERGSRTSRLATASRAIRLW